MKFDSLVFVSVLLSSLDEAVLGLIKNNPNGLDSYTDEEFKKLPVFREKVKDVLTKSYMLENSHLVRFLRARNSLNEAEALIRDNYRWRQLNDIDMIATANFSRWQHKFPYNLNMDREQRPGVATSLRNFDLRRVILRGYDKDFLKYFIHVVERYVELIPVYAKMIDKEFISANVLFNMAGFNARSHVCLACIPFWIDVLSIYQNQYPDSARRIIVINVPRSFQLLLRTVKPILNDRTLKLLQIYGVDKGEWQPDLQKIFPPEELTREFGGTAVQKHWSQITFPQHVAYKRILKSIQQEKNS